MSVLGKVRVPNEGNPKSKIYIIGEAPGYDEVEAGRPFIGTSGTILRNCLSRNGILEDEVYFANLCQFQPPGNKFEVIHKYTEVQEGIEEIRQHIADNRPNVVVALGNWPLYFLTGYRGKKLGTGITRFRGSLLPCSIVEGIKVVATFHPAYIARQRSDYPIFDTDIKRIKEESTFPELRLPERNFILDPRGRDLNEWVEKLSRADRLAVDIETVKKSTHILCVGFSPDPQTSVVISHTDTDFDRRDAINTILRSPAKKIFHNGGTFDIPMLHLNGYEVNNYWWDTMVAQHVMWTELPKSLDYLTSIYTRQPYYKTAGRAEIPEDAKAWDGKFDRDALYEYNAKDTAVTAEIQLKQEKEVQDGPPEWKDTIQFELDSMEVAEAISLTGMPLDLERRKLLGRGLTMKWGILQFALDRLTGYKTNVNSPKAMKAILFDKDKLALPPRRNRDGELTTDEDAIVGLIAFTKDKMQGMKAGGAANIYWMTRYEILKSILVIRGIRKLLSSYIRNPISDDGRVRSNYKVTGTDTGRWSASNFLDGTGTNCQTFPRESLELKNFEDDERFREVLGYIRGDLEEDVTNESTEDSSPVDDSSGT